LANSSLMLPCGAGSSTAPRSLKSPRRRSSGARRGGRALLARHREPAEEIIGRLAARLGLHPLAVEDSKQFGQRGKLQIYGVVAIMVGFGVGQQMRAPVE